MSVHSLSHQTPVASATAESSPANAHAHPSVLDQIRERYYAEHPEKRPTTVTTPTEPVDDECERCPGCGARVQHQRSDRHHSQWLGLGETDWCSVCGAEHEHWADECKKPLTEWRPILLLQMARDVENAYEDIWRSMTDEQVTQNREYLKRLIEALASSNLCRITDRAERTAAAQRWEDLRQEAAELFDKVCPSRPGRTFYKYASSDCSEQELTDLVGRLRAELAELESGASEQPSEHAV
ncbi:hypothetical protein ACI2VF_15015 [Ralstonia nicotianae]